MIGRRGIPTKGIAKSKIVEYGGRKQVCNMKGILALSPGWPEALERFQAGNQHHWSYTLTKTKSGSERKIS